MKLIPLGLILLLSINPVPANAGPEEDLVRETTRAVLEQLLLEQERLEVEPGHIRTVVNDLVVPHFEFQLMAQLALGQYWQELTETERACFVSGFKNTLVERYAYILLSYDNHQIAYESTRDVGELGYRLVRQTITRNEMEPLPIEYIMLQTDDAWKVVDLIVDGVSLVRNYRGIFQSRIHTQGIPYFIDTFPGCLNQ